MNGEDGSMMMPKALRTSVKRFGGLRKRVRLTLSSGSTTIRPNDILRIRLPDRSLVDLTTFGFNGIVKCDGTGAGVCGAHTLVRRFGLTVGGVNVNYANNYWNHTAHAMNVASQGLAWDEGNSTSGSNPRDIDVSGNYIESNYWPLTPMTAGMLYTGATGSVEVDIAFDGVGPIITQKSGTVATTWTLENVFAYVDVIQLEDDTYLRSIMGALERGAVYEKSVQLATSVLQQNTASNSFNISTKCLDKVLVAPKADAYATPVAQGANQVYNTYLDYPVGETYPAENYGVYVRIGEENFPSYSFGNFYAELANITRNNWAGSSYNFNKLFLTADASGAILTDVPLYNAKESYCSQHGVVLIPVSAFDEYGREGGIDLSSGNSVITVNTQGAQLLTRKLLLAGIHKSKIMCKAGMVVALQL